jgi:hypothetical protein
MLYLWVVLSYVNGVLPRAKLHVVRWFFYQKKCFVNVVCPAFMGDANCDSRYIPCYGVRACIGIAVKGMTVVSAWIFGRVPYVQYCVVM